jgi:hypothetical protein
MQGRAYLDLACEVIAGGDELHWRGAAIHAYYALFLECRDALRRWGVVIPRRQDVHSFVRLKYNWAGSTDLRGIGDNLDWLLRRRNAASYEMNPVPWFTAGREAQEAITRAAAALALLDAIDGDAARRTAAIASLPP